MANTTKTTLKKLANYVTYLAIGTIIIGIIFLYGAFYSTSASNSPGVYDFSITLGSSFTGLALIGLGGSFVLSATLLHIKAIDLE